MVEFGPGTERQYAALIGDVVSSRRALERAALQRRLVQEIDALNDRHRAASLIKLFLGRFPVMKQTAEDGSSTDVERMGRAIGILERMLVLSLVLLA